MYPLLIHPLGMYILLSYHLIKCCCKEKTKMRTPMAPSIISITSSTTTNPTDKSIEKTAKEKSIKEKSSKDKSSKERSSKENPGRPLLTRSVDEDSIKERSAGRSGMHGKKRKSTGDCPKTAKSLDLNVTRSKDDTWSVSEKRRQSQSDASKKTDSKEMKRSGSGEQAENTSGKSTETFDVKKECENQKKKGPVKPMPSFECYKNEHLIKKTTDDNTEDHEARMRVRLSKKAKYAFLKPDDVNNASTTLM